MPLPPVRFSAVTTFPKLSALTKDMMEATDTPTVWIHTDSFSQGKLLTDNDATTAGEIIDTFLHHDEGDAVSHALGQQVAETTKAGNINDLAWWYLNHSPQAISQFHQQFDTTHDRLLQQAFHGDAEALPHNTAKDEGTRRLENLTWCHKISPQSLLEGLHRCLVVSEKKKP